MTKDVIELAREAGLPIGKKFSGGKLVECVTLEVQHFAALVAARERERCAQLCESEWANVAEKMYGEMCAAAIRALNTEGEGNDHITG